MTKLGDHTKDEEEYIFLTARNPADTSVHHNDTVY